MFGQRTYGFKIYDLAKRVRIIGDRKKKHIIPPRRLLLSSNISFRQNVYVHGET